MRNDLTIYQTYAPHWWDGSQRFLRLLHNLVPARMKYFDTIAQGWSGQKVLDLGCGGGFMSEALAERQADVIGVDPSEAAIQEAQSHAHRQGLQIDYKVGTGEQIPLEDSSVNAVICVDVLEHVQDLDAVLGEVRRVLKPGGVFYFDTINRTWLATVVLIYFGETILRLLPPGTHDPQKFITPEELKTLLSERNFTMGPLVGLGPCGLNRRLDFTFCRLPSTLIMYMGYARLEAST